MFIIHIQTEWKTYYIIDFALSNTVWSVALQVHSVLADVSVLRDSQMSEVLGENLLK